jgi:hypothetical protein
LTIFSAYLQIKHKERPIIPLIIGALYLLFILFIIFFGWIQLNLNLQIDDPRPIIIEQANAERSLTGIPRAGLDLSIEDGTTLKVGYYNNLKIQAEDVIILIDECKNTRSGDVVSYENYGSFPVLVESPITDVEPQQSTVFEINIRNNLLTPNETYICKLKAVKDNDISKEYELYTFFMDVKE